MIRFGLLGCGRIGQVHALSLRSLRDTRLVAVADPVDAAAQSLAAETGAEVRDTDAINDFIEKQLGEDGLQRSVIVVATSDHLPLITITPSSRSGFPAGWRTS